MCTICWFLNNFHRRHAGSGNVPGGFVCSFNGSGGRQEEAVKGEVKRSIRANTPFIRKIGLQRPASLNRAIPPNEPTKAECLHSTLRVRTIELQASVSVFFTPEKL
jgi:hypothetical protein